MPVADHLQIREPARPDTRLHVQWAELFAFHVSPLELIVRGTVIYWFLFLLFRFVLRRDAGAIGVADILLVVLVADASQNGMSGSYETVAEGCLLVLTLIGWNYFFDWAGFHFKAFRRFSEPPPILLIDRGRIRGKNLRREFVTREELDAQLRKRGITDIGSVRAAYMESDGEFSVLMDKQPARPHHEEKRTPGA
jgi:uncharacterized membrane protein YcaP (DUF421 family)